MIQAPLALKATDTFSSKSMRNFSRYFVQKQTDERHRSRDLGEGSRGLCGACVQAGFYHNLPRRRSPTQMEQSKLHQTSSSTLEVGILIRQGDKKSGGG